MHKGILWDIDKLETDHVYPAWVVNQSFSVAKTDISSWHAQLFRPFTFAMDYLASKLHTRCRDCTPPKPELFIAGCLTKIKSEQSCQRLEVTKQIVGLLC